MVGTEQQAQEDLDRRGAKAAIELDGYKRVSIVGKASNGAWRAKGYRGNAIPDLFHNAATMGGDCRVEDCFPVAFQSGKRARLVGSHQAGVADVCGQDRRQFTLLTGQWNFLDVSHSCLAAVAPMLLACRTSGREE